MNELKEYQREMLKMLQSPDHALIVGRQTGKALYNSYTQEFVKPPDYILLEDHWEYPGLIRLDVIPIIGNWIESHDKSSWQYEVCVGDYERYTISPELYTLLTLKFS